MKKLVISLTLVLLTLFCVSTVGCKKDEWQEVQSITYTTDSGSTTLTSKYHWEITSETIDESEYNNAPWELKMPKLSFAGNITVPKDRNKFF
ncbi:MAG: hypothetical protein K2N22_02790, partial [Clostridia bacterium]|nr:hypothetical protein [Clostridia bacterium]